MSAGLTVILTHEHADFDALAAMLATWKLNPQAVAVLPRQLNRNVREFLTLYQAVLPFVTTQEIPARRVAHAIVVDTQSFSPVRRMNNQTSVEFIDHHDLQRELPAGWTYAGAPVGATTTLQVEKLQAEQQALTSIEATCLLLGIYEDTGALTYAATTARDASCAAWLLAQGADLEIVNRFLHHALSPAQQALLDQLLEHSEPFEFGGQPVILAWGSLPEFDDEISTLAHRVRDFYEPAAVFLLVELSDRIQLVARSNGDSIDVGAITAALGGGGHRRAAAALVRGKNLHELRDALIGLLQKHVPPETTVAEIMSRGLQTLAPDMTIAAAAAKMQRFGFEGYPVADFGKIVGMLTRGQVDRALRHGMASAPVATVMSRGSVTVSPEDSIDALQRRMMESGWGQVPVVSRETGELLGIVTRTDLIKRWSEPIGTHPATDIATRMESLLPAPLIALLRHAGEAATALNFPLYAVGGFARDLLLNVPNFDVDLVVEGDAIALARRLAEKHGGRVRSHRRFGTAKWILSAKSETPKTPQQDDENEEEIAHDESMPALDMNVPINHLDFVTARTEFYEHPTALPTVESSSIKLDLHRRDFTINTLAIRLDPAHWGELLDFYNGEDDLKNGVIRVLHSLSFIEDPTRILRAVRFEQRFQFQIETRTEQLITDALDLLQKVSPSRVGHELELILHEAEPELALARLQELKVLAHINAHLIYDRWVAEHFVELRALCTQNATPNEELPALYVALWLYRQDAMADHAVNARLNLSADTLRLLKEVRALQQQLPALAHPTCRASEIDAILAPISARARLVTRVGCDTWLVQQRIDLYERSLRHIKIELNGDQLHALGSAPGPLFRTILQAVRAARLDGEITTSAQEIALAQRMLAAQPKEITAPRRKQRSEA